MLCTATIIAALSIPAVGTVPDEDRTLFRFDQADSARRWQAVNDGVMGGRSLGRLRINQYKNLEFFGTLSLANNGGFASIRARNQDLGLREGDTIVARVRGDGRVYNFDMYSGRSRYSYRQQFQTTNNEWLEVEFRPERAEASWRGRRFPGQSIAPSDVNGFGFLLSDKKPGPFKLEIEWISVRRQQ